MEFIKKHKSDLKFLAILFISTSIFGLLNRPIGNVRNLYSPIDDLIPTVPYFIVIYHSWYPLMLGNLITMLPKDREAYYRILVSFITGQMLAYITFIFFQTDVTRALSLGDDIFSQLIRLTYTVDNHYAGFPSVHVTLATISILATWNSNSTKAWKLILTIWSILIIASTLLVKQHVFWDIPAGIVYGFVAYTLSPAIIKLLTKNKSIA